MSSHLPSVTTVRADADIVLSARTRVHLLRCPLLRDKAQEDAAQHWAAATVSLGPDGLYHSTYPEVLGVCALLHGALSPARVITTLTRRLKGPRLGQGVRRESSGSRGRQPAPPHHICLLLSTLWGEDWTGPASWRTSTFLTL